MALQQVSQKLKQENDALKDENTELRRRLQTYEDNGSSIASSSNVSARNTQNTENGATQRAIKRKFKDTYSNYSGNSYTPPPTQQLNPSPPPPPAPVQHSPIKLHVDEELDKFFSCGFCSEETPCVCRQVSAQDEAQLVAPVPAAAAPTTNLLDNPPSYAPAQPLRKKRTQSKKLFTVQTECSGDPDNCMACQADDSLACRDDKPGRAFFEALQGSVCQDGDDAQKCTGCPTHRNTQSLPTTPPIETDANGQSIPASDAWRRLKSHPNIGLADLALLADLVGSRTRCTGAELQQQVEKVLENVHPEAEVKVDLERLQNSSQGRTPHARRSSTSLQLPQLVPQEQLVSSSKRRKLLVEMGAVRDALDVLDRFSAPPI